MINTQEVCSGNVLFPEHTSGALDGAQPYGLVTSPWSTIHSKATSEGSRPTTSTW